MVIFLLFTVAGCNLINRTNNQVKPKDFERNGLKVTLTSDYVLKADQADANNAELYVESPQACFLGNLEDKVDFAAIDLLQYTQIIHNVASNKSDIATYEEDGKKFMYFSYEATANLINFKYLLITLESENYFATCNFFTYKSKYDGMEEEFLEMAKTIEITESAED